MIAGATIVAEQLERALFAPEVVVLVDSETHSRPVWNMFESCLREQNWSGPRSSSVRCFFTNFFDLSEFERDGARSPGMCVDFAWYSL
jgi:hypothetical protein